MDAANKVCILDTPWKYTYEVITNDDYILKLGTSYSPRLLRFENGLFKILFISL